MQSRTAGKSRRNKVLNPTVVLTALSLLPPTSLVGFSGRFLFTAFAGITALTGYDPLTGQPVEGPARLLAGARSGLSDLRAAYRESVLGSEPFGRTELRGVKRRVKRM